MDCLQLLKNKVVVLTGASSGIGAGTAVELAKCGCRLVLNGRNEENLKKTQSNCIASGLNPDQVITVLGSVEDTADCQRIIKTAVDAFGQLDVLVNNAGFGIRGTAETLEVEDFDRQLNINVRSVFQMSKFALPHLEKTKGNIVNVSSVAGIKPVINSLAYSTSKAAVDHLTRNLAFEFAGKGVRVNGVSPGLTVTEFHKRSGMPEDMYDKILETLTETVSLGRVGYPVDMARTILFLASDMASYITGVSIYVDGGLHMGKPSRFPGGKNNIGPAE